MERLGDRSTPRFKEAVNTFDKSMRDHIAGRLHATEFPATFYAPPQPRGHLAVFFVRWCRRISCAWSALCGEHDDEYNLRNGY